MKRMESAEYIADILLATEKLNFNSKTVEALCKARYETMCKYSKEGDNLCAFKFSNGTGFCDSCLFEEIMNLNKAGIKTIGSCCGHGRSPGYIEVEKQYRKRMEDLGYNRIDINNGAEIEVFCYLPKTILYIETNPEKLDKDKQNNFKEVMTDAEGNKYLYEGCNFFDKVETYTDCTVEVLTNTVTGECEVGWWKNDNPPMVIPNMGE